MELMKLCELYLETTLSAHSSNLSLEKELSKKEPFSE